MLMRTEGEKWVSFIMVVESVSFHRKSRQEIVHSIAGFQNLLCDSKVLYLTLESPESGYVQHCIVNVRR